MFNKRMGGFYRGIKPISFCKEIKSHTCLEIFQSIQTPLTEEDMASCSRAFRKPKNAEEERKLIENGTPKSTVPLKKYFLKAIFWNGRMVRKQKSSTRVLRTVTTGKSWVQRLDTAMASITAVSLNVWLIKLVTACVILKEH